MSVRTMARVWEGSRHSGTELLMLLAIADFADDAGRAYPSITTLAAKCRTKPRYALVLLDALSSSGELEIRKNAGPVGRGGRTNLYRIVFDQLTHQAVEVVNQGARVDCAEVMNSDALVNQSAVVHQGSGSSEPGFREVVNQGAPKPLGTIRTRVGAAHAQRAPAADRGSRLPEDWMPSEADVAFCQKHRPDLNPAEVAERFRDYWMAQPGTKGRKSSWSACWRTWCRNERQAPVAGSNALSGGKAWDGAL